MADAPCTVRMGGGMAAEVAQQCGGLGQGARTADAGAGGRLQRVFWRRNDAFCECRVRIVHVPKVRLFTVASPKWEVTGNVHSQ